MQNAKETIAEAIGAFANDLPGSGAAGVVFVGVKDRAIEWSGFVPDEQALQTLAAMRTDGWITPPPSMLVESRIVAGIKMAVVTVLPSTSPPVRYNGRIPVRAGARRGYASSQDERIGNKKRRHLDPPFDVRPMVGAHT